MWYLISGQLKKDIDKIMASLADIQAAVAALQAQAAQTQTGVNRLVADFGKQPTPAQLDTVLSNVEAVTTQLAQVDADVNAADPAPAQS